MSTKSRFGRIEERFSVEILAISGTDAYLVRFFKKEKSMKTVIERRKKVRPKTSVFDKTLLLISFFALFLLISSPAMAGGDHPWDSDSKIDGTIDPSTDPATEFDPDGEAGVTALPDDRTTGGIFSLFDAGITTFYHFVVSWVDGSVSGSWFSVSSD